MNMNVGMGKGLVIHGLRHRHSRSGGSSALGASAHGTRSKRATPGWGMGTIGCGDCPSVPGVGTRGMTVKSGSGTRVCTVTVTKI